MKPGRVCMPAHGWHWAGCRCTGSQTRAAARRLEGGVHDLGDSEDKQAVLQLARTPLAGSVGVC